MRINQALESVQTLGVAAEDKPIEPSNEELAAIPAELIQDITKRLREMRRKWGMSDACHAEEIGEELKARCCVHRSANTLFNWPKTLTWMVLKLAYELDPC